LVGSTCPCLPLDHGRKSHCDDVVRPWRSNLPQTGPAIFVRYFHSSTLAHGMSNGGHGTGPSACYSSAWIRVQCRRGEATGQRLPMVGAWILYILRVSCPFWERFCGYNSHGRESRASRGLLCGLEEDEAVMAKGDITMGTSSSRAI
jgi:hypothetical protein